MLRIAVCDDESQIIEQLEDVAQLFFRTHCIECKIQTYQSSENLQYDLMDGMYFDLLLLDIEMPGIDGMALAKLVCEMLPSAKVIFITSHLEFAFSAYEFSVFRYIPKAEIEEKLERALDDFYKLYKLERSDFYTVEVKNHVQKILYRDILYILKDGKYAVFHLQNQQQVSVRKTLTNVFEEIKSDYFYFADRGCIINLANVTGMNEETIRMLDGQTISISKAGVKEFKSILLRFWEKQI